MTNDSERSHASLSSNPRTRRFVVGLSGTAFIGMREIGNPRGFGGTTAEYVLACDHDAEIERLTRERDHFERSMVALALDMKVMQRMLSAQESSDETNADELIEIGQMVASPADPKVVNYRWTAAAYRLPPGVKLYARLPGMREKRKRPLVYPDGWACKYPRIAGSIAQDCIYPDCDCEPGPSEKANRE